MQQSPKDGPLAPAPSATASREAAARLQVEELTAENRRLRTVLDRERAAREKAETGYREALASLAAVSQKLDDTCAELARQVVDLLPLHLGHAGATERLQERGLCSLARFRKERTIRTLCFF